MGDRQPAAGVGLHQREGRARHLQAVIVENRPDQRPRQRCLAGAEPAGEPDHVARPKDRGEVLGEARRRRFVGEVDCQERPGHGRKD